MQNTQLAAVIQLGPARACLQANKAHKLVSASVTSSDPNSDALVQLCTAWQVLCLARASSADDLLQERHQASPDCDYGDRDASHQGYCSASSSCSSAASLAETVGAQPTSYRKHALGDANTARCRALRPTEYGGGDDLRFMVHDLDEHDESSDMDSSDCGEPEAESWLANHCDAEHYQRFEHVNLALLDSMVEKSVEFGESKRFWANTASNLEMLMALGLVQRYSLVVRSGQRGELVEVEIDTSLLRGNHAHDVCGLRILADVDTMHAHCADCSRCPTHETEDWDAWWGRALCLAEYASFLSAHASSARVPCDTHHDKMQMDLDGCDSGFDLAFLAD